jgi:hypothetical protein
MGLGHRRGRVSAGVAALCVLTGTGVSVTRAAEPVPVEPDFSAEACAWTEAVDLAAVARPTPGGGLAFDVEVPPKIHSPPGADAVDESNVIVRFVPPTDGSWDVRLQTLGALPQEDGAFLGTIDDCRRPGRSWLGPRALTAWWRGGRPVYLELGDTGHQDGARLRLEMHPTPAPWRHPRCNVDFPVSMPCGPATVCDVKSLRQIACEPEEPARLRAGRARYRLRARVLRVELQGDAPRGYLGRVRLVARDVEGGEVWHQEVNGCPRNEACSTGLRSSGRTFELDRPIRIDVQRSPATLEVELMDAASTTRYRLPVEEARVLPPRAPCDPLGMDAECGEGTVCAPDRAGRDACVPPADAPCTPLEDGTFQPSGPDVWVAAGNVWGDGEHVPVDPVAGSETVPLPDRVLRFTALASGLHLFQHDDWEARLLVRRACAPGYWTPEVGDESRYPSSLAGEMLTAGETVWVVVEPPRDGERIGPTRVLARRVDPPALGLDELRATWRAGDRMVAAEVPLRVSSSFQRYDFRFRFDWFLADASGRERRAWDVIDDAGGEHAAWADRDWEKVRDGVMMLRFAGRIRRGSDFRPVRARVDVTDGWTAQSWGATGPVGTPEVLPAGASCDPLDPFRECPAGQGCVVVSGGAPRCVVRQSHLDGGVVVVDVQARQAVLQLHGGLEPGVAARVRARPLDAAGHPLGPLTSLPLRALDTCGSGPETSLPLPARASDWTAIRAFRVWIERDGLPDAGPLDLPMTPVQGAGEGERCAPVWRSTPPTCRAGLRCRVDPSAFGDTEPAGICVQPAAPVLTDARIGLGASGGYDVGVVGYDPMGDVTNLFVRWLDAKGHELDRSSGLIQLEGYDPDGRYRAVVPVRPPGTDAVVAAEVRVRNRAELDSPPLRVTLGGAPPLATGNRCLGAPFDTCPGGLTCVLDYRYAGPGRCIPARPAHDDEAEFTTRAADGTVTLRVELPDASSPPPVDCHALDALGRRLHGALALACPERPTRSGSGNPLTLEYDWTVPAADLDRISTVEVRLPDRRLLAHRTQGRHLGEPCEPGGRVAHCQPGLECRAGRCTSSSDPCAR